LRLDRAGRPAIDAQAPDILHGLFRALLPER
jgi:hypothetical protein